MPTSLFTLPIAIAAPVYYLYLFLNNFAWMVCPLTCVILIIHSPHKKRLRWWLTMPLVGIAATVAGTLLASLILALPAFLFRPDLAQPNSGGRLLFVFFAGGLSALFSITIVKLWAKR